MIRVNDLKNIYMSLRSTSNISFESKDFLKSNDKFGKSYLQITPTENKIRPARFVWSLSNI